MQEKVLRHALNTLISINIFDLIIVKKLMLSIYFSFIKHLRDAHIVLQILRIELNWIIINRYWQAFKRMRLIYNKYWRHTYPRWHNTSKKTLWYPFRMVIKLYYECVSKYFILKRYAFARVEPSCLLIIKSRHNYRRCGSAIKMLSQI